MFFNQTIGFIESTTEELKRVNVDTKTFTQPNANLYTDTDAQAQTIAVFRQSL